MKFSRQSPDFYGIHFLLTAVVFFALIYLVRWIDLRRTDPGVVKSRVEKILSEKEEEAKKILESAGTKYVGATEGEGITLFTQVLVGKYRSRSADDPVA
jgi:hypothetical protein